MAHHHTRILYLGRNQAMANDLRALLCSQFGASRNDSTGKRSERGSLGAEPDTEHDTKSGHKHHGDALRMEVVSSQKSAMPIVQRLNPTLIVVETSNKPDSRLRFCQWLRERVPAALIIAIGTTVLPYHFAFDGVLRSPIDPAALCRLMAELEPSRPTVLRLGDVELDSTNRKVRTSIGENELTPKECALLQMLMERAGTVVRRAEIIHKIWETSYLDDTRTLDVHIRWLRCKVEVDPSAPTYLLTRRGEGYIFRLPEEK